MHHFYWVSPKVSIFLAVLTSLQLHLRTVTHLSPGTYPPTPPHPPGKCAHSYFSNQNEVMQITQVMAKGAARPRLQLSFSTLSIERNWCPFPPLLICYCHQFLLCPLHLPRPHFLYRGSEGRVCMPI